MGENQAGDGQKKHNRNGKAGKRKHAGIPGSRIGRVGKGIGKIIEPEIEPAYGAQGGKEQDEQAESAADFAHGDHLREG